jgi:hypothetical protein
VVGALVLAAVAIADPGSRELRRLDFLVAAKRPSELALVYKLNSEYLVRVDPRTLRPRGARLRLPRCGYPAAFAPGGARLVFGGADGRLCVVGTKSLRLRHVIETGVGGWVAALRWAGSRILALVQHENNSTLVAVDPAVRQVLARQEVEGSFQQAADTSAGLLLLFGPAETIGSSRLLLFAPDGTLRVATLDRIPSGSEHSGGEEELTRYATPALTVDQSVNRAFVLGAGTPVAEVDLTTFSTTYHDLSTPVSLLGRVHGWLEPAAEAKAVEGATREATWLGNGMLAVSGWNDHTSGEGDHLHFWNEAAGLDLIDTHDWSRRVLDEGATSMTVANGSLLAFSWRWDSMLAHPPGTGLTAYGPDGGWRFHLFGSRAILSAQVLGDRAFIRGTGSRYSLVDLTSGRVLRSSAGDPPALLLP